MKTTFGKGNRALNAGLVSLLALSLPALAQDAGKPSGIPWGPVVVYPEVDLTLKSNDNIYSQPSTGTRKSANITVVAPKVKIEAKDGPHTYDASYRVEHGSYSGVSSANYTDQAIGANAQWVFSGRAGLKLGAEYMLGHDDQGAVPGAATHANPDKYHQTSFNALGGYGAEGAKGRFEVEAALINKRYDNFKLDNAGNPDNTKRDRDDAKLGATFYWRVAPKTQLLFQAVQTKYDYKPSSFAGWTTLDSTERKYNFGVTWEAAAKTTGIFKVGHTKKDFSDASLRDFSGSGWEGQVKWSPLTYSNFNFTTGKSPGESTIGNASLDSRYGVTWNHAWNSRLSSDVSYNKTDTEYQTNAGAGQKDKIDAYGLKLNYKWTRNFKVGMGYDRTDKTSSNATSAYKRDIWSIFLNAAI
ncbi:MAG: outer membrane beta-barrel protein [Sulfuritalea sp.]|nr:outer membrane beta-barrel protein [Sulfuritalea sp.]